MVERQTHAEHPAIVPPLAPPSPPLVPAPAAAQASTPGVAFEVEGTLMMGGQAYVLARRLEGHADLHVTAGATLGDVLLGDCLELPHLPAAAVTRFEERTVFCLAHAEDLPRFTRRARVELRQG